MDKMTPMLKQYMSIKGQYPDAILFFRMGDFYEMFFEDAETASRILGITLTARGTYRGEKVPMCGIPHHASRSYVARLVASGQKVAICEQVEDPKAGRGIVRRDVVRLVTPGSIVDEGDLDHKSNLYMAAVSGDGGRLVVEGSVEEVRTHPSSQTARVLRGEQWSGRGGLRRCQLKPRGRMLAQQQQLSELLEQPLARNRGQITSRTQLEELRIYSTNIPAKNKKVCLMQNHLYRMSVADATMGYYNSPQVGFK